MVMRCTGCDYETTVVYDAACHSYALGPDHPMVTIDSEESHG